MRSHSWWRLIRIGQRPPFSASELVVMAIIDRDTQFSTQTDIFQWGIESFAFYKAKTMNAVLSSFANYRRIGLMDVLCEMDSEFLGVWEDYDTDLIAGNYHGDFTVSVSSAREVLKQWLEPAREDTFPFLDLPTELRNRIYENFLIFPRMRIDISSKHWPPLTALPKEIGSLDGGYPQGVRKTVARPRAVLNLAATCRQLAAEVIPVFYGCNDFGVGYASIIRFTTDNPTERLRHLKRISISAQIFKHFWTVTDSRIRSGLEKVADVVSLDELGIWLHDWRDDRYAASPQEGWQGDDMYMAMFRIDDLPFFHGLSRLAAKAGKVEVHCESRRIRAHTSGDALKWEVEHFLNKEVKKLKAEGEKD